MTAGRQENPAFVHSYDATAAWLAAADGTELGSRGAVHRDRPEFDPQIPGLWRLTPPAWPQQGCRPGAPSAGNGEGAVPRP